MLPVFVPLTRLAVGVPFGIVVIRPLFKPLFATIWTVPPPNPSASFAAFALVAMTTNVDLA